MKATLCFFILLAALAGCATPEMRLKPVAFQDIAGWEKDNPAEALAAFRNSCRAGNYHAPTGAVLAASGPFAAQDWQALCASAAGVSARADAPARRFFETRFAPYRILGRAGEDGALFTGYFTPTLAGARRPDSVYRWPVYGLPPELRNSPNPATPFLDRKAIDAGALAGRSLEILWVNDPIRLFFAHVQGSALVEIAGEHAPVRIAFAGRNGHPYTAIGKTLVEMGALRKEDVTMQSIIAWLEAHLDKAAEVMQSNRSYIFFALDATTTQATGAGGTKLSPGRSLAVDKAYIPLGWPVFVDTFLRLPEEGQRIAALAVAQDTGAAIQGPARADIFFGYGEPAARLAGRMNARGSMTLLVPRRAISEDTPDAPPPAR